MLLQIWIKLLDLYRLICLYKQRATSFGCMNKEWRESLKKYHLCFKVER